MADVTIRFRHNPRTGKKELVISYESEPDALPHEHERDHRALVEALLGTPLGGEDIVVERISKAPQAEEPEREPETPQKTPQRETNKG